MHYSDIRRCAKGLHFGFKSAWDEQLALIEFFYSNSYHASINMAPYKALYRRKWRKLLCW